MLYACIKIVTCSCLDLSFSDLRIFISDQSSNNKDNEGPQSSSEAGNAARGECVSRFYRIYPRPTGLSDRTIKLARRAYFQRKRLKRIRDQLADTL